MVGPNIFTILHRKFVSTNVSALHPCAAIALDEDQTLERAIQKMSDEHVGSIVVTANNLLVGILTERDFISKLEFSEKLNLKTSIKDIMTRNPTTVTPRVSIARAVYSMDLGGFRHLPVIDGPVVSVISVRDFIDFIFEEICNKISDKERRVRVWDNTVDQFFTGNIRAVPYDQALLAKEDEPILDVIENLKRSKKGAALVASEKRTILGIVTERDFVTKVLANEINPRGVVVKSIMTSSPAVLRPKASVIDALKLMSERGIRHLPLVNNVDQIEGILSIRNVLSYLANQIVADLAHKG